MAVETFGHEGLPLGSIHFAHNWEYADAAARTAATGFTTDDVGKLARQLDTNALWMLTDDSPVTWTAIGGGGATYTNEEAQDAVAAAFAAGTHTGITVTYTDASNKFDLAVTGSNFTQEEIEDFLANETFVAGTSMTITYNDASDTITFAATGVGLNQEDMEDLLGNFTLVAGTGMTLTYDDSAGTITFDSTGSYDDEQAQDAIGTILVDSSSIDFTYSDATPSITASVILEWLQDTVAAMFTGGSDTGITVTYQDGSGVVDLTVTGGGLSQEQIEDFLGATTLVAGTNMTITYNDAGGTITFDATGGSSYTAENARDDIAAALVAGNNIDITVNDGADTITIDVEALTSADLSDFTEAAQDALASAFAAGTHSGITITYTDASNKFDFAVTGSGQQTALTWTLNEGGVPIEGSKIPILVPFAHTVKRWYLMADQAGSVTIDVWRDSYSNYPPANADSIVAAAKPSLSAVDHGSDSTLSGWSTSGSANDVYNIEIESVDTITQLTFALVVERT